MSRRPAGRFCRPAAVLFALCAALLATFVNPTHLAAQDDTTVRPNYKQAAFYSSEFIRQRTYSTSVRPGWLGKTDRFWYSYQTCDGTHFYLVDPAAGKKESLFDHDALASKLSVEVRKPIDAHQLRLGGARINDEGTTLSFVVEKTKFELDLTNGELANKGPEPERGNAQSRRPGRGGAAGRPGTPRAGTQRSHRNFSPDHASYVFSKGHNLYFVEASDEVKAKIEEIAAEMKAEEEAKKNGETDTSTDGDGETKDGDKKDDEKDTKKKSDKKKKKEEDLTTTIFAPYADDAPLQEVTLQEKTDDKSGQKKDDTKKDDEKKDPSKETDRRREWANDVDESKALQLTEDGAKDYEFSSRGFFRRQTEEDAEPDPEKKTRPSVSWAEDSTAFHATRRDSRGVAELYLVNALSEPRPTLEKYKYPMPGEEHIRKSELFVFDRNAKKITQVEPKWTDESYLNIHWGKTSDALRMLRRDRLLRNVELCEINTRNSELKVILTEGFEAAYLDTQSLRYIRDGAEMIWWSERSGWGHYYLYDRDGNLKNAITTGQFRASRIVDIDEEKGLFYFSGNGREGVENVYFQHLYRVYLDGSELAIMDPGNANHRSSLSPTRNYVVDNCSRVDMCPISMLRSADGKKIMDLEKSDLSKLREVGWQMPETFKVKAADGVTDLYGNMWKPFDFDPKKNYPIIADVYPGPQTEGVTHTFSASSFRQQLAQVGFIVVQLGHRGGTPGRSKAYHSYGYFNLRDYGLADKKAGLEQLAARHSFIDIDRVGIYGHSGGGFMTAAAMLKKPYNAFFKVGIARAGNHDNNIYNNSWSERYHGLKEVAVKENKGRQGRRGGRRGSRGGDGASDQDEKIVLKKIEEDEDDTQKKDDDETEKDDTEEKDDDEKENEKEEEEKKTRFDIKVPTNTELAANLRGSLMLIHGDMDNNVHPAGTIRLANALIKANKRFDMLMLPGKRHGFGDMSNYVSHRMIEYFAEHLLGDHRTGADILEK